MKTGFTFNSLNQANILTLVSEEQIYRFFLGFEFKYKKCFHSPLREDNNPSFNIFKGEKRVLWKDFGSGAYGNVFEFVKQLFQVDYYQALHIINDQMGLGLTHTKPFPVERKVLPAITSETPAKSVIKEVTAKHFSKKEIEYWQRFGIELPLLRKYLYSIKSFYCNDWFFDCKSEDSFAFGHFLDHKPGETVRWKIYNPLLHKRKWISTANKNDIFNLYRSFFPVTKILFPKTLLITKSLKDVLTLLSMGINAIAFQSESVIPENQRLFAITAHYYKKGIDNILILYDNDDTGKVGSHKLQLLLAGNTPVYPLNYTGITQNQKDISDYVFVHGKKEAFYLLENHMQLL